MTFFLFHGIQAPSPLYAHTFMHTHTHRHTPNHSHMLTPHTHNQIQHPFMLNHTLTHQAHTHPLCTFTQTHSYTTHNHKYLHRHIEHTPHAYSNTLRQNESMHTHTHSLNTFKKKVFEHPTRH